jgi:hypothetical protein
MGTEEDLPTPGDHELIVRLCTATLDIRLRLDQYRAAAEEAPSAADEGVALAGKTHAVVWSSYCSVTEAQRALERQALVLSVG